MKKENKWFTLSKILGRVQQIFDEQISAHSFWIKVEIAQLKKDRKGHIYLDLVEHNGAYIVAKSRATIWSQTVNHLYGKLGEEVSEVLKVGTEVLCFCELVYSPIYGMSINVLDVDFSFTLGEIERIKQETLKLLNERGLIDLNKQLAYPIVIQRIALVGSVDTAGFIDFVNQLEENDYGFVFEIDYFNCRVQGDNAHIQIIEKLSQIPKDIYDVIVIIRGGGSVLDLSEFNNYNLAEAIAKMHTAVFTGIGHEIDSTIADCVAHTRFKTPSAVAAFIVEKAYQFSVHIQESFDHILSSSKHILEVERLEMNNMAISFNTYTRQWVLEKRRKLLAAMNETVMYSKNRLHVETSTIEVAKQVLKYKPLRELQAEEVRLREKGSLLSFFMEQKLQTSRRELISKEEAIFLQSKSVIDREKKRLEHLESIPTYFNFDSLLKKGFAIIRFNGETIKEHTSLESGDEIEVEIYNKRYQITIDNIKEVEEWMKKSHTKKPQMN
ncbi:exodeoxyribonuclease VII large subunit [Myroides pelagicus]|uniref:exodeoxyribonuclease VII large subunit n=1 Tax=Myroides pelagicus TaxID=270914 RepID=UPI0012B988AD|nr:exodeoxyribonuclease VII large subunit [Myroides pelagicus]MEC4113208.1 exodeoxyribonuclease VII large subunit [Myroides pelagicus]